MSANLSLLAQVTSPNKRANYRRKISKSDGDVLYRASGTAPPPCKDFSEVVLTQKDVIWRKWIIRYTKEKNLAPSQESVPIHEFPDKEILHQEITRFLGDDVLHQIFGTLSKCWLPRLPMRALRIIVSHLPSKDLCMLQRVNSVLSQRLRDNKIWMERFAVEFVAIGEIHRDRAKKVGWKKVFVKEWLARKEAEINWDNV